MTVVSPEEFKKMQEGQWGGTPSDPRLGVRQPKPYQPKLISEKEKECASKTGYTLPKGEMKMMIFNTPEATKAFNKCVGMKMGKPTEIEDAEKPEKTGTKPHIGTLLIVIMILVILFFIFKK